MLLFSAVLAISQVIHLYVDPNGSDSNAGSLQHPLFSLEGARRAVRKHPHQKVIVQFSSGIYRVSDSVRFSDKDSGDITYQSAPGAQVTLCGSVGFKPKWSHYSTKVLKCTVPKGLAAEQLFLNGDRQILARYPNEDLTVRILHGYAADAIAPERIAKWKDPTGGYLHAMHAEMWGDFHYRILGKDDKGGLKLEGGWQNNRQMGMHKTYRFVEGIFEELDAPGEWFLDRASDTLYLYPRNGTDVQNCLLEVPTVKSIVEINGAKGLTFRGIHFKHTLRTFMENREPLLRSDWTIYRGGALHLIGASNCSIEDCVLDDLGGNAIFVDGMNRHVAIRRCRIENVGANGVAFVGSPKAVRSPLFEYNQRQSYAELDKTPGPKTEDYPADCLVEDCLIDRTGTVEKQTAGVQIAMSARITVRHCSIYHVPRAGINIGDGCWGGHLIEGCDVFDTVLETGDHGSFNSWGRDRYWGLTDVDMNLGKRPELAELDTVQPTVIRNNRWRCDHGWDIDLDDGSSRYIIQNNLCLNGGIKNREGFGRVVENNIMVANSFHPHVWFLNSGDVFRHNIVFTPYQPIQVPKPWGREVDHNFHHTRGETVVKQAVELADLSGRDSHSLSGDAQFINPAIGDFTVKKDSPAKAVGFQNFKMDDFGVRPLALRNIARHPVFTHLNGKENPPIQTQNWQGATLKDLLDPSDLSATGSGERHGVLVTAVAPGSNADQFGLIPLDVIRSINGVSVSSVLDVEKLTLQPIHTLTVWRNQKTIDLKAQGTRPAQ